MSYPHKRQKHDCNADNCQAILAWNQLGSKYDVIRNHVPSDFILPMSKIQLMYYFLRMEGCCPGSLFWEPKLIQPIPFTSDYSDDPSLRKMMSQLSSDKVWRILDNLHALNPEMYHLLKMLLIGAPLLEPQGCYELNDTVWIQWVTAQISILPKTWETSLESLSMELGHLKEVALFHHQPNTEMQLTQQNVEILLNFWYESRSSNGHLSIIYPCNHGMLLEYFNRLSVEQFLFILDVFHALDTQLYISFKRILQFEGSRQDLDYYWNWVRSFSSLPLYQGKLKDSHVQILENHQQGNEIQPSSCDHVLLAMFVNQDWYKPPKCVSGDLPVVKSQIFFLVNSLSNDNFRRILDIFYDINQGLYLSFKRILANQETLDDHRMYDQAVRQFPTTY